MALRPQDERNRLVESNLGLATHFADQFHASRMEREDMVQEAYLGLIDAAERYDASRGTKFSTYARWHILKRIMDAIHNRNEVVRTPRRRPSHICSRLKPEHQEQLIDAGLSPDEQLIADEQTAAVHDCIKQLPDREGIVIRLRHGINTPAMTLAKVGDILGVTPERVRQIQNAAEEKLRKLLSERAILEHNGAVTAEHLKESAQPNEEN